MIPIRSFSRHAKEYNQASGVQKKVAQTLVAKLPQKYARILDIGAGTGAVYEALGYSPEFFLAIDSSDDMLNLHPKHRCVNTLCADFDSLYYQDLIRTYNIDCIISSSSLQWSCDFEKLFSDIIATQKPFVLSLFTAQTFNSLHKALGVDSPIVTKEYINSVVSQYNVSCHYEMYTQEFDTTKELLKHISQSGVAGSKPLAHMHDLRRIIAENRIKTLEHEVVYISNIFA